MGICAVRSTLTKPGGAIIRRYLFFALIANLLGDGTIAILHNLGDWKLPRNRICGLALHGGRRGDCRGRSSAGAARRGTRNLAPRGSRHRRTSGCRHCGFVHRLQRMAERERAWQLGLCGGDAGRAAVRNGTCAVAAVAHHSAARGHFYHTTKTSERLIPVAAKVTAQPRGDAAGVGRRRPARRRERRSPRAGGDSPGQQPPRRRRGLSYSLSDPIAWPAGGAPATYFSESASNASR